LFFQNHFPFSGYITPLILTLPFELGNLHMFLGSKKLKDCPLLAKLGGHLWVGCAYSKLPAARQYKWVILLLFRSFHANVSCFWASITAKTAVLVERGGNGWLVVLILGRQLHVSPKNHGLVKSRRTQPKSSLVHRDCWSTTLSWTIMPRFRPTLERVR